MDEDLQRVQLDEIMEYYKGQPDAAGQENLVSMLREIRELLGCIPEDIQLYAAELLGIKETVIRQIIKLYPSLTSAPSRHRIVLCLGPSCSAQNAAALADAVRAAIRYKPFHLTTKNCLKECRTSPNMRIDGDLYTNVTPENLPSILEKYNS